MLTATANNVEERLSMRKNFQSTCLYLGLALGLAVTMADATADEAPKPELVVSEDFSEGAANWEYTDPEAWTVGAGGSGKVLSLTKRSNYEPPVRSPHNMARITGLDERDFLIEARVRYTGRDYGHADLCFFLNYQDPAHFYYIHIAEKADPHANSIFLVNNEPRVSIARERNDGTDWTDEFHTVWIHRCSEGGVIRVYFDDPTEPIMVTEDTTHNGGAIGIGSFDDTGDFDYVKVWRLDPGSCADTELPIKE